MEIGTIHGVVSVVEFLRSKDRGHPRRSRQQMVLFWWWGFSDGKIAAMDGDRKIKERRRWDERERERERDGDLHHRSIGNLSCHIPEEEIYATKGIDEEEPVAPS
ncbi:hypothetical protein Q3G72_006718 [Acer saccharum]|nr:hypothetical protein Q3G72_006718 [Acer saccharum]